MLEFSATNAASPAPQRLYIENGDVKTRKRIPHSGPFMRIYAGDREPLKRPVMRKYDV